jgi:Spy/CpxP family protein refolding chaperone
MRTRIVIGSVAVLAIALGVSTSAQRPGGSGNTSQAGGPPPVVSQQGDPQQGQAGPGGQAGAPQGGMAGGMMNGPNGQRMGMRGRGGQMPPNGHAGPMNGRGGRGGQNGPGGLNLTPEQQASIAKIRLDTADASAPFEGQGRELREELHRAAFADTKDAAKLTDLTTRIVAIEKQFIEIQTKSQTEVATVLTAEQRKKMRVMGAGIGPTGGTGRGGQGQRRE